MCEYNNREWGGCVGGARVKLQTWGGGAFPKRLKTPDLEYCDITNIMHCFQKRAI